MDDANCANPALPVPAGAEAALDGTGLGTGSRRHHIPRHPGHGGEWEQLFSSEEQGQHPTGAKSSRRSAQMSTQPVQAKLG